MALSELPTEDLRRVVTTGAADMDRLCTVMSETRFFEPFDWTSWIKELPQGALTDPAYVDTVDLETLRKLVIAHIRIDRFNGGHLDKILAAGYMERVIARAAQILEDRMETA